MSRPRDADKERTYARLLETATQVLSQLDDPSTLTMREVANAAGVSLGTIHYYFESKRELLEACLDAYYDRLRALAFSLATRVPLLPSGHRAYVDLVVREFAGFVRKERGNVRLRLVLDATAGELHPRRQIDLLETMIRNGAVVLRPLTGLDAIQLSLAIQSMAILIVRFGLASEGELRALIGEEGSTATEAVDAFLSEAAYRLLASRAPSTSAKQA